MPPLQLVNVAIRDPSETKNGIYNDTASDRHALSMPNNTNEGLVSMMWSRVQQLPHSKTSVTTSVAN